MRERKVPRYTRNKRSRYHQYEALLCFVIGTATNHVVNRRFCLLFSACNVISSNNLIAPTLVIVFAIETWILRIATAT